MPAITPGNSTAMAVLLIILLIALVAGGLLWQVLEVAFWIVSILFLAVVVISAATYGWLRKRAGA